MPERDELTKTQQVSNDRAQRLGFLHADVGRLLDRWDEWQHVQQAHQPEEVIEMVYRSVEDSIAKLRDEYERQQGLLGDDEQEGQA